MLNKKRRGLYIAGIAVIGIIAILGGTLLFFYNRNSDISKEAQTHIDNILSLSGKLTPDEEQIFISEIQAFIKLLEPHYKEEDQGLPFVSDAELERLQQHTMAIMQENPDLAIHAHFHGEGNKHGHETGTEGDQTWIHDELAGINAVIEEVKASNISESAKEALLSVLEHRRYFLMNHEKDSVELEEKFREFYEQDPTIVGVTKDHITGEYIPMPPNMLELTIHRYTRPDGTVGDMYVPSSSHATDREVSELLTPYLEALETLPPWEVPPPPEHPDLKVTIRYAANYGKETGEETADESLQTAEQNVENSGETSIETGISDAYPDPVITPEEVEGWRGALEEMSNSTDSEMETLRKMFEKAIGIPMDRFLEMTDAEIEAHFSRYAAPSEADVEKQVMSSGATGVSVDANGVSELQRKFSPQRFNRAMQTLERYGPEEGLRRLKEVDPEISTSLERMIQSQKEE